jgi:hypothetical protein
MRRWAVHAIPTFLTFVAGGARRAPWLLAARDAEKGEWACK